MAPEGSHDHATAEPAIREILSSLGLSAAGLHHVESYSHSAWTTADVVVRYRIVGPTGRLLHEAAVAACLPPEALYPEVVASGCSGDDDWLVTARVPGEPLLEVWPRLSRRQRERATHELAVALEALHGAPARHLRPPCLFGGAPVVPRSALIDTLIGIARGAEGADPRTRARVCARLDEWRPAIDDDPSVMAHHDLSFGQCIWDGHHLAALVDLEMSHASTPDWDLPVFLDMCAEPRRGAVYEEGLDPRDFTDVPGWLWEAYPALLSHPALPRRLRIYELIYRLAELTARPDLDLMLDILEHGTAYEHFLPDQ
jgi:aminoglycoside phosphotransferase (APT) family kinase protein